MNTKTIQSVRTGTAMVLAGGLGLMALSHGIRAVEYKDSAVRTHNLEVNSYDYSRASSKGRERNRS